MIKDVELRPLWRLGSSRHTLNKSVHASGIVLAPGLVPIGDELFRMGDTILLRRPDGLEIKAHIDGLELPHTNPNYEVIILLKELAKDDVPIGTEVWSV
jgi:hypothetical protein